MDPLDLCGPFGSGGGSIGTHDSPPPSDLASSLLERGGRRALSSSRSLAATPPECGGSHTLSSSPVHSAPVRAKEWDGAGSAGGEAATYQFGRLGGIFGTGEFPIKENRPLLQDISPIDMRAGIPKKSLGRHEENRTTSLPGGGREGEAIRAHPVTLPLLERSSKVRATTSRKIVKY